MMTQLKLTGQSGQQFFNNSVCFKTQIDSPGPITLQSNNWKNIEFPPSLKPNEKIEFKKSLTAFIPGILGIDSHIITLGAAKMPKCSQALYACLQS